jgi:hypothetical protein
MDRSGMTTATATTDDRPYGTLRPAPIYHCPYPMRVTTNPFHREWLGAIDRCLSDEDLRGCCAEVEGLTIVTYNNRPEPQLLERCLDHIGIRNYVVLGKDVQNWTWLHKISLVHDYLASGACNTPYILCLDGDDVIIVRDPADLVNDFLATGTDILFCGTRGDQPPSPECWEFENAVPTYSDPQHRHLNAGCYLGRTDHVHARLGEIAEGIERREGWCFHEGAVDDQLAWRHLHRRYWPAIQVDVACRLFLRFDEDR